jgi:hypothetical protein
MAFNVPNCLGCLSSSTTGNLYFLKRPIKRKSFNESGDEIIIKRKRKAQAKKRLIIGETKKAPKEKK